MHSFSPFLLGLPASASVRPQILDSCPSLEILQALRAGTGSSLWVISKPCLILYLWGRGELLAGALDCLLPLLSLSCYGDGLPLLSLSFPMRREGIPGSQKEPPPAFVLHLLSCGVRKFFSRESHEIKPDGLWGEQC